jgi:pilus assembly protein CpaF
MEGDVITMQELIRFERTGIDTDSNVLGSHKPTGIRPKFMRRCEEYGLTIPADLFRAE